MFTVLYSFLSQRMQLTTEQFNFVQTLFIPKQYAKGEFLIREGEVAKYGAFVAKGCLRSYVVDNKGKEHIVQFAPETWWLTDINSIMHGVPSLYFMDALEPSDVLLIDAPSHKRLMEEIPGFANAFFCRPAKAYRIKR